MAHAAISKPRRTGVTNWRGGEKLERAMGIEPTTYSLGSCRSTTELRPRGAQHSQAGAATEEDGASWRFQAARTAASRLSISVVRRLPSRDSDLAEARICADADLMPLALWLTSPRSAATCAALPVAA
jgi:hypothetical protein